MEKGKVIILNGVSSSGKTTLAKTLQKRMPYPLYHMDVDAFAAMTPDKYHNYEEKDFSVQHKFVSKMFYAIKLFSDLGFSLVVPCIFLSGSGLLEECVTLLHEHSVLLVYVTCPVEELRRREKERGDREIGGSEAQLSMLSVLPDNHDIAVDTCDLSIEECADKIIEALNGSSRFSALNTLFSQIQSRTL